MGNQADYGGDETVEMMVTGALLLCVGFVLGYWMGYNKELDGIPLDNDNEVLDRYRTSDKKYLTYKKYKDEE